MRINSVEASSATTIVVMEDFMGDPKPKIAELAGFGLEVKKALASVEEVARVADTKLRVEIDKVTGLIDSAFDSLNIKVASVASLVDGVPSVPAHQASGYTDVPAAARLNELDRSWARARGSSRAWPREWVRPKLRLARLRLL